MQQVLNVSVRTGNKAEVYGLELELRKNIILLDDEDEKAKLSARS